MKDGNRMLRPCPFCGGYVEAYNSTYHGCPVIRHERPAKCVFHKLVFYSEDIQEVIRRWNHRTDTRWEDDVK